jgi:hypothetical protein
MSTAVLSATTPATANQLLAVAEQTLLTPYNLSASGLAQVFGTLNAHRIDDADVYFQYTRSEGWSLEEGIVKAGSFSIDQGVGVRAIAGEKTAFAYSDEISTAALGDAARATRAIAKAGQSRRAYVPGVICRWIRLRLCLPLPRWLCLKNLNAVLARWIHAWCK